MPGVHRPPVIVLVRPQIAENIGAAARAMANFSAADLRLVDPRPYDPEHAARMACDGKDILQRLRIFPDLGTAIADCAFSIATSRRPRRIKIPPLTPLAAVEQLLTFPRNQLTALVFGSEQSGLMNEELFLCDSASTIPASEKGSLNLGQSVMVYLYEWFQAALARPREKDPCEQMATHQEKQRAYKLLEKILLRGQYKPLSRLPEFIRRVKLLFETRPLTHREQRILLKMLRYIEKSDPNPSK